MTDDRFEAFLQETAQHHNRPPETPREPMWTAIRAARRDTPVRVLVRRSWTRLSVGIAAALAVGVGIGRLSVRDGATGTSTDAVGMRPNAGAVSDTPYRLATARHLDRVETFLTGFQMDVRTTGVAQTVEPTAQDLLLTTRLFLDTKGASDPQLRALLEDIELVLAQIAQLPHANDSAELDLIEDGIEHRSVLLRLDAAKNDLGLRAAQGVL